MTKIVCPCCRGEGVIKDVAKGLTRTEKKMLEIVSQCKDGISMDDLVGRVYADRSDGGPDSAKNVLQVLRHNMIPKLAKMGIRIHSNRGPGALWRVIPL